MLRFIFRTFNFNYASVMGVGFFEFECIGRKMFV